MRLTFRMSISKSSQKRRTLKHLGKRSSQVSNCTMIKHISSTRKCQLEGVVAHIKTKNLIRRVSADTLSTARTTCRIKLQTEGNRLVDKIMCRETMFMRRLCQKGSHLQKNRIMNQNEEINGCRVQELLWKGQQPILSARQIWQVVTGRRQSAMLSGKLIKFRR